MEETENFCLNQNQRIGSRTGDMKMMVTLPMKEENALMLTQEETEKAKRSFHGEDTTTTTRDGTLYTLMKVRLERSIMDSRKERYLTLFLE
jgi:hypothetical protein